MSAAISPPYNRSRITHDDQLPAPLPRDSQLPSAPPPPPKETGNLPVSSMQGPALLPPIPAMSSLALDIPSSPVTPLSPPVLSDPDEPTPSPVEKSKKPSPLADLIESEKLYVEFLTGVIRKVAAAWSRSNLPPPELDIMFRSVEGVYKVNRTLLGKLKEIGENPSSPKALGDLLMRWIDDLDRPYTTYSEKYCSGFDSWEPVRSNPKLGGVLEAFSLSNPPPVSVVQASQLSNSSFWTLDALFLLPRSRLQYYRKLYGRLLKSTMPGKSDYRLLTGALEKLDNLLSTLDRRAHIKVSGDYPSSPANAESQASMGELLPGNALLSGQFGGGPASTATSLRGSYSSTGERLSLEPSPPPVNPDSIQPRMSVAVLETRLTTENTLDIFTMQPKAVRLQLIPPMLPFTRELRASVNVVIRLTPKSTGVEVIHRHGHVFILSDLFLVCERLAPEKMSDGGPDMRLCYPPLSGKVLKVMEVPEQANAVNISIMRKETLTLEADSQRARHEIMKEFKECIAFARTIAGAAQEPVPPLPTKSALPEASVASHKSFGDPPGQRPEVLAPNGDLGGSSPPSIAALPRVTSPTEEALPQGGGSTALGQLQASRASMESASSTPASPSFQVVPGVQRIPSIQNPIPGRIFQGTPNSPPLSFTVPGQIIPPARSTSIQSPDTNSDAMLSGFPGRVHSSSSQTFPGQSLPPMQMHPQRHQPSINSLHQRIPQPQSPPVGVPAQYPPRSAPGQGYPSRPLGPPYGMPPPRPPSEPASFQRLQKSLSSRSLASQYEHGQGIPPPMPSFPGGPPAMQRPYSGAMNPAPSRPLLPSQVGSRTNSLGEASFQDPSPPTSPVEESRPSGPVRSTISAQMKCKVFHKQHHAQWKSLGSARLTLYRQEPTNVKQLVVEADSKEKGILISAIVLTDGVERVGKTGVAIELSDAKGGRTGIVYMIQLRNESSASGLFDTLLAGSDRSSK
ncbi:hypothetical protein J3A83DRAFT_4373191 [Scleroderma citrinum]